MDKKDRVERVRKNLKYGKAYFDDAASDMEKLGDKKGAATVRKHADDAVKTVPSADPKQS